MSRRAPRECALDRPWDCCWRRCRFIPVLFHHDAIDAMFRRRYGHKRKKHAPPAEHGPRVRARLRRAALVVASQKESPARPIAAAGGCAGGARLLRDAAPPPGRCASSEPSQLDVARSGLVFRAAATSVVVHGGVVRRGWGGGRTRCRRPGSNAHNGTAVAMIARPVFGGDAYRRQRRAVVAGRARRVSPRRRPTTRRPPHLELPPGPVPRPHGQHEHPYVPEARYVGEKAKQRTSSKAGTTLGLQSDVVERDALVRAADGQTIAVRRVGDGPDRPAA